MSSFIWGMIVFPTQRNSQMAGRELRDLLFSPRSSIDLLTVLHTDIHLGSAYTPLHFGLSLCNLLQHVWLPYPRWKGTSIALIWGIGVQYKCCIYRDIKCRNFPSDPASYFQRQQNQYRISCQISNVRCWMRLKRHGRLDFSGRPQVAESSTTDKSNYM